MNVCVTLLPGPWVCAVASGQPAHKNVYRSRLELYVDMGCGMKVIQLVRLRASERNRRMLRNTVEVNHIHMFYTTRLEERHTSPIA